MLLVGWEEGHPACKITEWWRAGVVICLGRGADLHMPQLMPLPLTISCFSKSQIGSGTSLPCNPGQSPGGRKTDVCMYVCNNNDVLKHLILLKSMILQSRLFQRRDFISECHTEDCNHDDDDVFSGPLSTR